MLSALGVYGGYLAHAYNTTQINLKASRHIATEKKLPNSQIPAEMIQKGISIDKARVGSPDGGVRPGGHGKHGLRMAQRVKSELAVVRTQARGANTCTVEAHA